MKTSLLILNEYSLVPVLLLLASLVVIYAYLITEEKLAEIQAELAARRAD